MKAKKNLCEAPATKVFEIVMDELSMAYELIEKALSEMQPSDTQTAVMAVAHCSEWNLPTQLMIDYMLGWYDLESFEEKVNDFALASRNNKIAA